MVDEQLCEKLVDWAKLDEKDIVLEIGAGCGSLTKHIAKKSTVIAVEIERHLTDVLKKNFQENEKVDLIRGDALKIEYPMYTKIVSNIPYSISRKLFERLVCEGFELAVLVVQMEFAQKLLSKPSEDSYRMLSVLAQTTCDIKMLQSIPPTAFRPQPNVESAALLLKPVWKPKKDYITFLNAMFSKKNKLVKNIIEKPGIYGEKRPKDLLPGDFLTLYQRN